ncbi:MAG: RsmE family RNA methyltransferase, partial [Candidatus Desantisbacteria bacterium]
VYPSPTLQITIVQSIPKLDKVNLIVEKCTELGVSRIIFVETSRSVKKQINLSRLERIAVSASSQSGRIFLPMIEEARFCDALDMVSQEGSPLINVLGLMLWENAKKGIGEVLRPAIGTITSDDRIASSRIPHSAFRISEIVLFVGPEGGFSQEEADEAVRKGIIPVSLGNQILRTETAGLVGLTIAAYEMGLLQ